MQGRWWRLQGICFQPAATFRAIRKNPNWLLPLLAIVAVGTVSSVLIHQTVGVETILRSETARHPQTQDIPSEKLDEAVANLTGNPLITLFFYALPAAGAIAVVLACAVVFLFSVQLAGGRISFDQSVSVTAHAFFLYYLIYSLLTVLVALLSPDPSQVDFQNPVYSNLGFLVDRFEAPALYNLASSLDLISMYAIFLLGLGLSAASEGVSLGKGVGIVAALWLVYIVAKAGVTAIIS
ncbi:MAG: YIP1 family protein [Acidobacteriota bacterium]